jgi:DNA helicase-2/ATP-dependent DNA helicase PcrA
MQPNTLGGNLFVTYAAFLDDLNPQQRQAVELLSGPVLVLAGPGSGKTRVLTYRVAYLVRVCGVAPHRILAVTFTNKAAREMRERLITLLGEEQVRRLTIGTFHAICARILHREASHLAIDPQFLIYDVDDQKGLVRQSMRELNLDEKQYAPSSILYSIGRAKDELLDPDTYARQVTSYWDEIVARVYQVYQRKLQENRALDFDDLLMQAVRLFEEHVEVRERYQQRYLHVLVDEYQDTNHAQYVLIRHLSSGYRNLFVVGDEEQAIYAWRGATLRNILEFEEDFPEARVILLEQNYRSTRSILRASRGVITASQHRPYEKNLWTENPEGAPLVVRETYDEREEARMVADEITRLLEEGYSRRDIAVMYRTNAQSRAFEEAFLRYGLRYKLVGGTRFYQRREVRDILAYLRLIHNPYDSVSLLRIVNVPSRGIGPRTLERWRDWAYEESLPLYDILERLGGADDPLPDGLSLDTRSSRALRAFRLLMDDLIHLSEEKALPNLLDELFARIGYRRHLLKDREMGQDRWDNVQELRTVAQDFVDPALSPRDSLATFLEETALIADIDEYDDQTEAITLITLHQAKGLEFPVVFIVGMEEGMLPHARSMTSVEELEEERRLCYVGMTRAKARLYLLRAFKRTIFGNSQVRAPSRFLANLDQDLISDGRDRPSRRRKPSLRASRVASGSRQRQRPVISHYESAGGAAPSRKRSRSQPVQEVFILGDRVQHPIFGEGVIVSVVQRGADQELTVAFEEKGLKKLMAGFARLEKV